jgi:CubicO group peptidase (beta-lactamase class C family)
MTARTIASCVLPIALLLPPIAGCGPALGDEPPSGTPAELTAQVDGLFASWSPRDTPGCAVGIVQRGQLIYSKGFGSANLEDQVPNTPQTVFDVASFSKSLTCV